MVGPLMRVVGHLPAVIHLAGAVGVLLVGAARI